MQAGAGEMDSGQGRSELTSADGEFSDIASSLRYAPTDPDDEVHETVLRMCHDLVTPAVTIRHLAEAIEAEPGLSPKIRRYLALIAGESTHICEICAFTLEMVREPRPMRLDEVVSECVATVRTWFVGTIEERVDPVMLRAERVSMFRMVSNLLNNACRAAGPGGSISIRLAHDTSHAYMEVINSGAQFEPAMNLGTGTVQRPSSIGLRIVAEILADHQGHARIEPNTLGGTSVKVRLPLDATGEVPTIPGDWPGDEQ